MNTKILKTTASTAGCRMFPKTFPSAVGLLAAGLLAPSLASAQLFSDVPGLSTAGQNALATHFDARVGVSVNGTGGVTAWEGRDGNGNVVVTANRSGNNGFNTANNVQDESDSNNNITHNASKGSLTFTEDNVYETAHLYTEMDGLLSGGAVTIFWKGFYGGDDPQDDGSLGRYAYNLTSGEIDQVNGGMNHQRRDAAGNVAAYFTGGNGTVRGDSITGRNDVSTVYRSVYDLGATTPTADFFADGTDLNMDPPGGGTIFGSTAEPNLYIGAISYPIWYDTAGNQPGGGTNGGWSFIGEMEQLIIFEGTLSSSDVTAVESYLSAIPEPSSAGLWISIGAVVWTALGRRRLAK